MGRDRITRRDFIKYSALGTCSAFLASKLQPVLPILKRLEAGELTQK